MNHHKATAGELESFTERKCVIAGDDCFLIFPQHIGVKWTKQNEIYRSSMWRESDNHPVSLGFKKFYNYTEHPELCPDPVTLNGATAVEKIDGSCLIVSKYKGQLIVRTRGTVSAFLQDTGPEIQELMKKYPKAFEMSTIGDTAPYSLLYEYVSPNMRIVLDYGPEPDIYLIGKVYHEDYHYETQARLDHLAVILGVKRPKTYRFDSVEQMITSVKALKGKEGVVVYFDGDQKMKKLKGLEYLTLHAFKSDCSLPKMVDIFIALGCPTYKDFEAKLAETYDYECVNMARGFISQISDAWKEVEKIKAHMAEFVAPLRDKIVNENPAFIRMNRKDAAKAIVGAYGKTNRAGFAFTMLDNKPLLADDNKKLLFQALVK